MTNISETGWLTKDPAMVGRADGCWLAGDRAATGDMVVHSRYMIHTATANAVEDGRMRLSTDIRYRDLVRDEIDPRWERHS